MFFSVLCLLCLCARLFICALWSSAGKGLTSWLWFVVYTCKSVTFPLASWSSVGLDCIDSWSLYPTYFYQVCSNYGSWAKYGLVPGVSYFIKDDYAGPRSAVGNVSGYRCVSDFRSRGREFDPSQVPYFRGDWSWNDFYGHSPPSADSFKKGCCQLQAKVCARITG